MKKWFKRSGIELVLGIGLSLFLINYFTDQSDDLYVLSIPLTVFGLIGIYKRRFGNRCYSSEYGIEESDNDDLYNVAEEIVRESGNASTSYLQRRLRIGYSRAARLIDLLEDNEVIGPAIGSKPREVFKKKDAE